MTLTLPSCECNQRKRETSHPLHFNREKKSWVYKTQPIVFGHAFDTVGSIGMAAASSLLLLYLDFLFSNPPSSFIFFRHLQSDVFRHGTFLLKHCRAVWCSQKQSCTGRSQSDGDDEKRRPLFSQEINHSSVQCWIFYLYIYIYSRTATSSSTFLSLLFFNPLKFNK